MITFVFLWFIPQFIHLKPKIKRMNHLNLRHSSAKKEGEKGMSLVSMGDQGYAVFLCKHEENKDKASVGNKAITYQWVRGDTVPRSFSAWKRPDRSHIPP